MKYQNLHDLLVLKLQALYDIEMELVKALPKVLKKATDKELAAAFETHLGETEQHIPRLEEALKSINADVRKEQAEGIRGIGKDAAWVMKTIKNDAARDAALIAVAQYAEHYEMAGYGAASEWAREMGHDAVVGLLEQTLAEEKAADAKLTELAKGGINARANTMKE